MNIFEESIEISGQTLTLQTGKLARAATTSIFGKLGETCVLVTVTVGRDHEDIDYLPLQVEYVEKLYAGGRIKGSRWVKREGRPSDDAILKARLIDRSIRPLFSKNFRRDIQIIITLLSIDGINPPEILSAIAVSAALYLSPIPWNGPLGTVRVGYVKNDSEGSFFINPTEDDEKYSALDLIVSSTKNKVVMIETKAEELSEKTVLDGIKLAKQENSKIIDFIESLRKKAGKPKVGSDKSVIDEKIIKILKKDFKKNLDNLILKKAEKEFDDEEALEVVVEEVMEKHKEEFDKKNVVKAIDYLTKQMIHDKALKTKKRIDGRGADDLRELSSEVSILPRTHGSGIFQRGDTQVLSIVTLGAPSLEQLIESPEGEAAKSYIHHYYMPPYSVGETGRIGFPSRREVGHGALAEKAIEPVLPSSKDFPYTIRVVSEVMSSNGSTSMASTCGSTIALMDAGVPIKAPVAGIAMGLLSSSDDDYMILTDIMGIEDFSGEMDFKVAGTEAGITAIQLDVKNAGLTDEMIEKTMQKAKVARLAILDSMKKAITKPRTEISKYAPKVVVLSPPQEKIGEIIGPGGKNIRALIAKTETDINVTDDGKVTISGIDKVKVEEAVNAIENITRVIEVGEEFEGTIKRILQFGAFVEFLPGKEGLVHVSKMSDKFVKDPNEVVKIGQKVKVRVCQVDQMGRINLQMIK
ncbi:MAG: Polyribonucleotide nucleotidyltransferase [Candidatus Roizmanbacteria bacterium GW2011_GWA2_36_23]|uniref:Polyribonucleotide nucleotidyltransferase n=1 Tax=Candidatus Roizmanbacteria bacterium GW2011_GWA2_36_23 TaxID=1618480 RepID=A0A0G0E4U1_9BACT|nr:MAG: Polyribonucleotide nucleotidyltransferase [Candidatus Roizmanbacteria bacterium GW2011_GWA2_36_23]